MSRSSSGRVGDPQLGKVSHYEDRQTEYSERSEKRRKEVVREAFDEVHDALGSRNKEKFTAIIDRIILPSLDLDRRDINHVASAAAVEEPFYPRIVRRVVRNGVRDIRTWDDCANILRSLETVASHQSILPSTLQEKQAVLEYQHQIGIRHLSGGQRVDQTLNAIDKDDDLKATLCTGGQGAGKSTAVETLVEDRIENGHKIIDLVDFHKGENCTWDIPDQSDLSEIRDEMGLDSGFGEYQPPDVEVLAPLSPDLSDTKVPVKHEDPVVRPFTIPASELTFRQLVMLLPHTTTVQENYIRSAHQKLSNTDRDWKLRDVADVIRNETNAKDAVSDRIERSLRTAQQKSFIRDNQCDRALDWDEIMADKSVVTAFTVHMIREPTDQLLVVSYLLDCIYEERQRLLRERRLHEFPTMTVVMRELHKIVPDKKSQQDSESTIEGYMIDTMAEMIGLMRHVDTELLCDTQKFKQQLASSVSGLFHRVFCFRGQKPDIKHVFQTRVSPRGNPEEKISQYDDGVCALVSENGYKMPIEFAPPRCHHLDAKTEGDGFSFRAKHREDEQLEPSPWDVDIPDRLKFGPSAQDPIEEFFMRFVRQTGDESDYATVQELSRAFNNWARSQGYEEITSNRHFGRRINEHFELDPDEHNYQPLIDGEQRLAKRTLVLDSELIPE